MSGNGPEFFQTRMGQTFYDGTMPRLTKAIERVADRLDVTHRDTNALDAIAARLDGRVWSAYDLDAIAAIIRATGRAIRPPVE